MDSPSASSSTNPSFVFNCPENPQMASSPYAQGLQELRQSGKLIDIHLQTGEKKLPAHRVVLANSCTVLKVMLSEEWDPERNPVCQLGEDVVDPHIAGDLLDFFYLREVTITLANAKQLLIAANYLDLSTLKAGNEQFLADHLQFSSDDIVDWLNFTEMYQLDSLRKPCIKFIFENYTTVLKMEKLLTFSEDYFMQLLNDLKVFGSSIVNRAMFGLLIQWIQFDITTRADSLLNILKMFPFLEVSESFITNTVLKEELIVNSPDCIELGKDALNELSSLLKAKHLFCIGPEYVYHLDVAAGTWTKKSSMIHSCDLTFCSAAIGDKIYIFGGHLWNENKNANKKKVNSAAVHVFDIKNDRWTELAPMPVERSCAAAVAMNGYIYVSGGFESFDCRTVARYCMATNEWTSVASMLKPRVHHNMVSFNDYIYALGGDRGGKDTVEKYSPEANKWEMVPAFDPRYGDVTVLHQGKFYAFNLDSEHLLDNIDTVQVYDPLTESTETFQDSGLVEILKVDTYPYFVSVGDKIWALGYNEDTFGEFDPVTRRWKEIDIDVNVLDHSFYKVVVPQLSPYRTTLTRSSAFSIIRNEGRENGRENILKRIYRESFYTGNDNIAKM